MTSMRSATCGAALVLVVLPACMRAGWEVPVPAGDAPRRDAALDRDAAPRELTLPFDRGASCEMSSANVPASCTCEVVDFNGDGLIGVSDLAVLSSCFGRPPVGSCAITDTNQDGRVDCPDLACLAKHYLSGECRRRDAQPGG